MKDVRAAHLTATATMLRAAPAVFTKTSRNRLMPWASQPAAAPTTAPATTNHGTGKTGS